MFVGRRLRLRTAFGRREAPLPASGRWPAIPGLGHIIAAVGGFKPQPGICRPPGLGSLKTRNLGPTPQAVNLLLLRSSRPA
jgi:hypothetical protein